VYNLYQDKYISTIGVKVSRKSMIFPEPEQMTELTLMLWDLAGSEEFSQMQASYMRGAVGAILVCDLTRPETLPNLFGYRESLQKIVPEVRLIVAANKNDLTDQHQLTVDQVAATATTLQAPYYLTSAKTGDEVETLFRHLGQLLLA
jgi:small GTP-binding protein